MVQPVEPALYGWLSWTKIALLNWEIFCYQITKIKVILVCHAYLLLEYKCCSQVLRQKLNPFASCLCSGEQIARSVSWMWVYTGFAAQLAVQVELL